MKMDGKEQWFEDLVLDQLNTIKQLLIIKGKEYRRDNNPFHNFEQVAKKRDITSLEALIGMYMKHEQSFHDMVNDYNKNVVHHKDKWDEKITDIIIYLILAKGIVIDKQNSL